MDREVIDLDILRPEPKIIKLGGHEIDVSFVPCALTFEVDRLSRELVGLDLKEVQKGGKEAEKAFGLSIDMCAVFCSAKYPDMTREWFMQNTDPVQINRLADTIKETLQRSYAGAEAYGKNQ